MATERPVYSRGLMGSRSAQRPQPSTSPWGKPLSPGDRTAAVAAMLSPSRADAPARSRGPVPMPPPSAVPSVRPVARQRPTAFALDLFEARGTPAVALRSHRMAAAFVHPPPGRDEHDHRPSRSRARAMGLGADDLDDFAPSAAGGSGGEAATHHHHHHIPITVEDGWGDFAAAMPPLEHRNIGTSHGRRRR
jgi:hypothetical protein